MSRNDMRAPNIEDHLFARTQNRLDHDDSVGYVIRREQEITDDFLALQAHHREITSSRNLRLPEQLKVASIPVIFVEKWLREGFNIYQAPVKEIVKRLQREGLTDFLSTERRVF